MSKFDVLVAGGGPGGLAAAEAAARSGCSVLLVEQNKEIGSPTRTTGGSFIEDLRELGIPNHLYHPIRRIRFLSPNNAAQFDYDEPVTCVLDVKGTFQFLAERAADAGVTLRLATTASMPLSNNGFVTGLRIKTPVQPESAVESKIVIDATGYRAAILKQSGVHPGYKRFGVGSEYDLYAPNIDETEGVLIVGSQIAPAGYAWIFPWGRKRVRVGVGIIHSDSDEHPDPYLDRLVNDASKFGVNLRGAQPIEYHYGLIPSEGPTDAYVGNGILAVGDAAGQPSALVGEGIRWAIQAGRRAGKIAGEAVHCSDFSQRFLSRYAKQWKSDYGRDLTIAYEINRRMARFSDADWDRKTDILRGFNSQQFGQALKTDFSAGWAAKVLWKQPQLLKHGIAAITGRLGSASAD